MIFGTPVIRHTGDLSVTVEFGDELSLEASFKVLALMECISQSSSAAVIETIPTHRSLGLVLDARSVGTASAVESQISKWLLAAAELETVQSRIVHVPMLYDDPWSSFCASQQGAGNSFAQICQENGLDASAVIDRHTSTDHWVGALGFTPGCTQAFPLEGANALVASKCAVPRTWTFARTVGLGGFLTAPYTVKSPGGYQMLGRTPLDWYDPTRKNPTFGGEIILCRVGDRQRFAAISLEEYDDIRERVVLGTYEYRVTDARVALRSGALVDAGGLL